MFAMTLPAKVRSLSHQVKNDDGLLMRSSKLSLHMEFTKGVATGINDDAQRFQQLLADRALKSASIPMSALKELRITFGDGHDDLVLDCYGNDLVLKEPNAEDASPQATLNVGFSTADEPVLWLLHHLDETLDVRVEKRQLEMEEQQKLAVPPIKRRKQASEEAGA